MPHNEHRTTKFEASTGDAVQSGYSSASTSYKSLVERSIIAWSSLNWVGTDLEPASVHCDRHMRILKSVDSLEALLAESHKLFWFFQLRESFFAQKRFLKWDGEGLDAYILIPIDYGFVNNRDCFFISHYWHTQEHPDPTGSDLHLFKGDLATLEWSYIWVDYTCMPQSPRTEFQQAYFQKMLKFIPALVRDCGFSWRFLRFEPRAWILYEVAEYLLNHSQYIMTDDLRPFFNHVAEMVHEGVRPVITKYGYSCTNGSDLMLVTGWLEIIVILYRLFPSPGERQAILDDLNRSYVGGYHNIAMDLRIDKAEGIIMYKGIRYQFTPIWIT